MTNLAKLHQAARLIAEVNATLNNTSRKCDCCGLTVYEKPDEWDLKQMLSAALSRVEKVVGKMKNNDKKDQRVTPAAMILDVDGVAIVNKKDGVNPDQDPANMLLFDRFGDGRWYIAYLSKKTLGDSWVMVTVYSTENGKRVSCDYGVSPENQLTRIRKVS
jgi:hypothetical protein